MQIVGAAIDINAIIFILYCTGFSLLLSYASTRRFYAIQGTYEPPKLSLWQISYVFDIKDARGCVARAYGILHVNLRVFGLPGNQRLVLLLKLPIIHFWIHILLIHHERNDFEVIGKYIRILVGCFAIYLRIWSL